MTEPRGIFSPLEDVILRAEHRAEQQHRRATEPCPHDQVVKTMQRREGLCMDCGEWVEQD